MVSQSSEDRGLVDVAAACRSCGEVGLTPILSLGNTPLANALLDESALAGEEPRFPLDLALCPACALVQITATVPPEQMFREYSYFSSYSETMLTHARSLVERLIAERALGPDGLAGEIASNDGYLLQYYKQAGVPVLGVEPAENVAQVAIEKRGIRTVTEFFGSDLGQRLAEQGDRVDVIHANNVLAHVPDLNGVVAGFRHWLKPHGVVVVEAPYVKDLIDHVEFDTIYHEHLCYFSLTALTQLFERQGLKIRDVERLPIHGGSLRIFAVHADSPEAESCSARYHDLMREEAEWGVRSIDYYAQFSRKVDELRTRLVSLLHELKTENKRIAVYGASAKGSTLMNCFGIGSDVIDFVVDRNPVKQGRYTPGTHLKIHDPEQLLTARPDYTLLLTWNFADEILEQQAEYRKSGGKFIIPIPDVRVA